MSKLQHLEAGINFLKAIAYKNQMMTGLHRSATVAANFLEKIKRCLHDFLMFLT